MPKYKMELAKTQKPMMSRRLELALTCLYENGEAEFRAVLGNPRLWSFSMHKKLMYKYTVGIWPGCGRAFAFCPQ